MRENVGTAFAYSYRLSFQFPNARGETPVMVRRQDAMCLVKVTAVLAGTVCFRSVSMHAFPACVGFQEIQHLLGGMRPVLDTADALRAEFPVMAVQTYKPVH